MHKAFHGQDFQRINCFVNSTYPSGKFTRTVDVNGLGCLVVNRRCDAQVVSKIDAVRVKVSSRKER